jgi:regulator of sirC expression with transglutaminase-like and TPR domain
MDKLMDDIRIPESAFEICEHLGFTQAKSAQWAWFELAGAVLSHYVVNQEQRLNGLLRWFYQDLGFRVRDDYFSIEAADLGQCIMTRQGNSTSLATVLVLLAKQLDLQLEAVLLPGNTVLKSTVNGVIKYHDPLTGGELTKHGLKSLVRGELGNEARLKPSHLKPATLKRLLSRMIHELKAGSIVKHKFEPAMECCSLLLQWHPDDVHLNRERAFIAQQLGCIKVAMSDLQHFIDNSPHDPVIELVKIQLKELSQQAQIYH